jgi:hypothetical protein
MNSLIKKEYSKKKIVCKKDHQMESSLNLAEK